MTCPACSRDIPDLSTSCPHCGHTIEPGKASVQLDFDGTAMQLLGWLLLTIVATIVVVPLAWVMAAINRWLCRNLKFADGSTAAFRGTGGQVVGWVILLAVAAIVQQILTRPLMRAGTAQVLLVQAAYLAATLAINLQLVRWFVAYVELSSGPPLRFSGTYGQFVGWYLLLLVSLFTIIGWAWAYAGMCGWFARNTRGQGIEFQFHGKGHQILWRMLVMLLASALIIPIPWMWLWFLRWIVQNLSLTRGTGAPAAALP